MEIQENFKSWLLGGDAYMSFNFPCPKTYFCANCHVPTPNSDFRIFRTTFSWTRESLLEIEDALWNGTRKHPRSKVARRAFCVEIRKKIMWTIRISKMICTDDASSISSSTLRRGFLGFWSSIHANTTLNWMFWSSFRKILKMMSPIQEKIAKKIVKKI